MLSILIILFATCFLVPVYSYITFPWIIKQKAKRVPIAINNYALIEDWPDVTIIFSVYNEEKVIAQKLNSIFSSDYPKNKLKILIGSDCCSDKTVSIIEEFILSYPDTIVLVNKTFRHGKLKIVNELVDVSNTPYIVFTDANVFFEPGTIKALVYNLVHKDAAMVCGNIKKYSPYNSGISQHEIFYMDYENTIKHNESLVYNFIAGVEGGCYAIKKEWFIAVPDGFIMDDFFITLNTIAQKGDVLFEPAAVCFEDVNDAPLIEFNRKTRISLGNFRNLYYYQNMLFPIYKGFGFVFFSHKVLRWLTPFFILFSFIIAASISFYVSWFFLITVSYSFLVALPFITIYCEKIKLKLPLINPLGHFILMNFALLIGFFKFVSTTSESSWEPPKRNV